MYRAPTVSRNRRTAATRALYAVTLLLAAVAATLPFGEADAATPPVTVVSLTFDDANTNQMTAATILNKYDVDGTFFINSGFVGAPGYLTLANLQTLKSAGHEIGGHTLSHPDLTALPADEAKRQICNDRAALLQQGFAVRSFAYPFAVLNAEVKATVAACGYNSARGLGDLRGISSDCKGCPNAETMPPTDPFETKAPEQVESSWKLKDLQNLVTAAEKKGGWLQLTFHNVCTSGCDLNVTPSVLDSFVAWTKARSNGKTNTTIKPVGTVIGGDVKPPVTVEDDPPIGPGENGVTNPGMETLNAQGDPVCWMKGGYGSNTATLSLASTARSGARAGQVSISSYVNGDAKWLPQFDLGTCSPGVAAGHTYSLRSWYTSTAVTQFAVYLRDSAGAWHYWTSSPWFADAATYTQAVWTTPEIPTGMTAISFGLNLFNNGTLVTDDTAIYDTVGAPAAAAAVRRYAGPVSTGEQGRRTRPADRVRGDRVKAVKLSPRLRGSGPHMR